MGTWRAIFVIIIALGIIAAFGWFLGSNAGKMVYLEVDNWSAEVALWKVLFVSYLAGAVSFIIFFLILGLMAAPDKRRMRREISRMRKELDNLRNMPLDSPAEPDLETIPALLPPEESSD